MAKATAELTQEEIRERAAEVRAGWNDETHRKRAGLAPPRNPIQGAEKHAVTLTRLEAAFILGGSDGW